MFLYLGHVVNTVEGEDAVSAPTVQVTDVANTVEGEDAVSAPTVQVTDDALQEVWKTLATLKKERELGNLGPLGNHDYLLQVYKPWGTYCKTWYNATTKFNAYSKKSGFTEQKFYGKLEQINYTIDLLLPECPDGACKYDSFKTKVVEKKTLDQRPNYFVTTWETVLLKSYIYIYPFQEETPDNTVEAADTSDLCQEWTTGGEKGTVRLWSVDAWKLLLQNSKWEELISVSQLVDRQKEKTLLGGINAEANEISAAKSFFSEEIKTMMLDGLSAAAKKDDVKTQIMTILANLKIDLTNETTFTSELDRRSTAPTGELKNVDNVESGELKNVVETNVEPAKSESLGIGAKLNKSTPGAKKGTSNGKKDPDTETEEKSSLWWWVLLAISITGGSLLGAWFGTYLSKNEKEEEEEPLLSKNI